MSIEAAQALIAKTKSMSVEELVLARRELYDYLNTIVDLADHNFSVQGVQLRLPSAGGLLSPGQICVTNLFQLHYLLNIGFIVMTTNEIPVRYVVRASYHEHDFVEVVSQSEYDAIYKDISTLVSEHEIFSPYNH